MTTSRKPTIHRGPIRRAILDALRNQGHSKYWLEMEAGLRPGTLTAVLRRDFRVTMADRLMAPLGLATAGNSGSRIWDAPLVSAIVCEMLEQGRSQAWLGEKIGVAPRDVSHILHRDFGVGHADNMLRALKLKIVPV